MVQQTVKSNDAAKRAGGIGLKRLLVGVQGVGAQGHAARVGVFDNHARRAVLHRVKAFDALPSGIGIGDIVVRQLLTLQLPRGHQRTRGGVQVAVKRRGLMRVFAITQVLNFHKTAIGLGWVFAARAVLQIERRQIVADGGVVVADAVVGGGGQGKAHVVGQAAFSLELGQHRFVLTGVGDHAHVFPVFGGAAHHGGAANVDVFNGVFQLAAGFGNRSFKGVEVDHQQIDRGNVVLA